MSNDDKCLRINVAYIINDWISYDHIAGFSIAWQWLTLSDRLIAFCLQIAHNSVRAVDVKTISIQQSKALSTLATISCHWKRRLSPNSAAICRRGLNCLSNLCTSYNIQGAAKKMTQHIKCDYLVTPENFCAKFGMIVYCLAELYSLMCWFCLKLLHVYEIGITPNFKFGFCNYTSLYLLHDVTFRTVIATFTEKVETELRKVDK